MRWSGGQYWASDVYDLEFQSGVICALRQRRYRTTMSVCQSNALHSNIDAVRIESSPDCVSANVNAESSADNTGCCMCGRNQGAAAPAAAEVRSCLASITMY